LGAVVKGEIGTVARIEISECARSAGASFLPDHSQAAGWTFPAADSSHVLAVSRRPVQLGVPAWPGPARPAATAGGGALHNAILAAAGYNFGLLLRWLAVLLRAIAAAFFRTRAVPQTA
jgi:hypothetical protein